MKFYMPFFFEVRYVLTYGPTVMCAAANKEALLEEKEVAEEHLRRVREQLAEAEERFAGLKASGVGGTEFNRDVYDKLDDEIGQLKSELKQNLAACSRLESVSMSCRLGALGLAQRLAPLTNLVDHSEESEIALTVRVMFVCNAIKYILLRRGIDVLLLNDWACRVSSR